jgi:hypothetical protein
VRGFHGHGTLAAAHLDARKWVGQHIALFHQPAEQALSTASACATERAERLSTNGRQSGDVRGRGGPTQRSRGVGLRKNAR